MTPTEENLIAILSSGLKLRVTTPITPQTQIFGKAEEGLGLDSVDVLEIAVLLDKHFGVMLEEESAEVRGALANIGSLAAFIDRKHAGAGN
jgi:acyl carrier protein